MSRGAVNFDERAVEYYTPKRLVNFFGPFDYDPATTPERALYHGIPNYTSLPNDGLEEDWTQYERIWINPPFSDKHRFWWKVCDTYQRAHNEIYFLAPISFLTTTRSHQPNQSVTLYLPPGRIEFEQDPRGGGTAKAPAFGSVVLRSSDYNHILTLPREVLG